MPHLKKYAGYLLVIVVSAVIAWLAWPRPDLPASSPLPIVMTTSRLGLDEAEADVRQRLATNEADVRAGVRLAEILLRKARVETDAGHAIEAERVLRNVLTHEAAEYSALKLLG